MQEKIEVQDNIREMLMREMFGLLPGDTNRIGNDAYDITGRSFELKSTTKNAVSMWRAVTYDILNQSRKQIYICAKGNPTVSMAGARGFSFEQVYVLLPERMKEYIDSIEDRVDADFDLIVNNFCPFKLAKLNGDDWTKIGIILKRGGSQAGPKMSWSYVVKNGIRITEPYAENLRRVIESDGDPSSVRHQNSLYKFLKKV